MNKINFPLKVVTLRVILAFIVMLALFSNKEKIAVGLFLITTLISFADNYISKKRKKGFLLKSIADYFADRLLVDLTALVLVIKSALPFWVLIAFFIRDFFTIVIGTILIYRDYRREFSPTALGKINLLFQVITIFTVMIGQFDIILVWITVVITAASGIEALFKSEFKLKRETGINEFRIFRNIKFADTFTFLNVVFGLMTIIFSIRGLHTTASIMMLFSVASDYLDGKIAKSMQQTTEFGRELDSLADTISFGVAPAIFGFSLIQTPIAAVSFTVFLLCGILRLARYNITNLKFFQGMPITLNGAIIPFIFFIDLPKIIYPYAYLILGILMVSSFRVKRLG